MILSIKNVIRELKIIIVKEVGVRNLKLIISSVIGNIVLLLEFKY